jgi:hypothetical protein
MTLLKLLKILQPFRGTLLFSGIYFISLSVQTKGLLLFVFGVLFVCAYDVLVWNQKDWDRD